MVLIGFTYGTRIVGRDVIVGPGYLIPRIVWVPITVIYGIEPNTCGITRGSLIHLYDIVRT